MYTFFVHGLYINNACFFSKAGEWLCLKDSVWKLVCMVIHKILITFQAIVKLGRAKISFLVQHISHSSKHIQEFITSLHRWLYSKNPISESKQFYPMFHSNLRVTGNLWGYRYKWANWLIEGLWFVSCHHSSSSFLITFASITVNNCKIQMWSINNFLQIIIRSNMHLCRAHCLDKNQHCALSQEGTLIVTYPH